MNIVDFCEIPKANTGNGDQDTFEMFARDLLEALGFRIIQGPGRGNDAGRDLIIEERRVGVGGETLVRWLVSCKHYAHGGKSIGVDEELNISDRLKAAKATGFLGFYSTLPSSGLVTRLQELASNFEHSIFDRARIETHLLARDSENRLFSRYFPVSLNQWSVAHHRKPNLYFEEESLVCEHCGKDLLIENRVGLSMFVQWLNTETSQVEVVYCCCKGHCDDALRKRHSRPNRNDLWDELRDYTIPTFYIISINRHLTAINDGERFKEEALADLKKFLISTFHHVSRSLTPAETEVIQLHIHCGVG